mmetsp:Transcript_22190/g.49947  ORF Transcript_22190/g.49947 Transcript_22190/m.49947 type:complete len:226 (-) Transcript_22190:386-1063(-)
MPSGVVAWLTLRIIAPTKARRVSGWPWFHLSSNCPSTIFCISRCLPDSSAGAITPKRSVSCILRILMAISGACRLGRSRGRWARRPVSSGWSTSSQLRRMLEPWLASRRPCWRTPIFSGAGSSPYFRASSIRSASGSSGYRSCKLVRAVLGMSPNIEIIISARVGWVIFSCCRMARSSWAFLRCCWARIPGTAGRGSTSLLVTVRRGTFGSAWGTESFFRCGSHA